jgi:hypothetical protein
MTALALLPLFVFILVWLFFLSLQSQDETEFGGIRKALIFAGLFWSAALALGTELLSLVSGLTAGGVAGFWAAGIVMMGLLHWHTKFISKGFRRIERSCRRWHLSWFEWVILAASLMGLLILLITGLLSPPNVHDVLAYHMSRVMHWAQNNSLAFFPTPNTWQLWMPPFSEFSQLHFYLLSGSDLLAFLPGWYSLILSMAAVSLTAKRLGVNSKGQWLSAFFVLSLPIIVLQASGGKNDIVLGFFFAALATFVVESNAKKLDLLSRIGCGLSVGLGVLTKGTFPFFALIFLVWLFVNMLRHSGWVQTLGFIGLGLVIVLALNGGHWVRNTLTFGNPLYTGYEDSLINARFGLRVTVSNLTRHMAVQLNGKYGLVNETVEKIVSQIHDWMDLPLFDPGLTHGPGEFYYVPTREEVAGNPFHFALTILSFFLLLVSLFWVEDRKQKNWTAILSLASFASVILFSMVFRWQAWSTRFFIPYYIAFAPVIGFVFGRKLPSPAAWLLAITLGIVMVNPLLNNYSRSFSWAEGNRNSIWRVSRKGLLFANNQAIEGAVLGLTQAMEDSGCRTYGVVMRRNAPEYLLWGALRPDPQGYTIEHIQTSNASSVNASPDFDPCGIILFEMTEMDLVDQTTYQWVKRWGVGETYPFSLYLKSDFTNQGLE